MRARATRYRSVFAGVLLLRTDAARTRRVRENALHLVFKIVGRLGRDRLVFNDGAAIMDIVLAGEQFVDGILVRRRPREEVRAA